MTRPFFSASIEVLEAEFERGKHDRTLLAALLHELGYRSTDRAVRLRARVAEALARYEEATRAKRSARPSGAGSSSGEGDTPGSSPGSTSAGAGSGQRPTPPLTDAPEAILDAWTALEVLSPPGFRRPEDLATGGERWAVAWLDRGRLPWEGAGEKARPHTRLFYQVVLGTIDLDPAVARLLARFGDTQVERPTARGQAVLAVAILSRDGTLVEIPAVAVSSFAWGLPRALEEDLAVLAEWPRAERALVEGLDEILRRAGEEADRPLDRSTIAKAWEWLVSRLSLPRELVSPPRFAIRSFEYYKSSQPPEPLLLNSFFLKDLSTARLMFAEGRATANLKRYVGAERPAKCRDLLHEEEVLEEAVAPPGIPPARWPGPERRSLVLLQQVAVNLAFQELGDKGILAVNGPPGTGKTTLLRDLVAGVVTARAEAMAGFDDPTTAFLHSGEKLKVGQSWLHLYRLDRSIRGFEMLVASSNNKVVENVSAELPALKAIAEDATSLRYLSALSDALHEKETWGLVAAVLGNAANRSRFRRTFWWDEDVGFSTYLAGRGHTTTQGGSESRDGSCGDTSACDRDP